jgi:hypothetical protein
MNDEARAKDIAELRELDPTLDEATLEVWANAHPAHSRAQDLAELREEKRHLAAVAAGEESLKSQYLSTYELEARYRRSLCDDD